MSSRIDRTENHAAVHLSARAGQLDVTGLQPYHGVSPVEDVAAVDRLVWH
jgi:hypothetical protein